MVVPDLPAIGERGVEVGEVPEASGEPSADIGIRDGVSPFFHSLADSADCEFGRGNPEIMEFDEIAESLCAVQDFDVGCAAEGALESE